MNKLSQKFSFGLRIIFSIILTATLALSTHVLITQYYNPPTIHIDPKMDQMLSLVVRFATVIGTMLIYILSKEQWAKRKPCARIILFALLLLALTEQLFRVPIMEMAVGTPLAHQLLSTIPTYLYFLLLSMFICLFLPFISIKNKFLLKYIIFAVLTTILLFFIKKFANDFSSFLEQFLPPVDMTKVINPPYGMNILIPAYLTFLEPTLACFILFYLMKKKLSVFHTITKGFILGGLLMLIHGGPYLVMQIFYSEGNLFYRIFYYGQFIWEYLTLGILTVCSFALLERKIATDTRYPSFKL